MSRFVKLSATLRHDSWDEQTSYPAKMVEVQEILQHLNGDTLGIIPTRQDQLRIGDR